ncbi:unnamed protein product [Closterium sp. NIES-54]
MVSEQLNLWPHVSLPETSPTMRWTGKVGDASVFRVWGSRAFVRDTSADKLSARTIPCVFLGFPLDAPGWQFYHPTSRRVLPSQDVTFDESVPFYCLFPYSSAPLLPPLLFLAPGPPPVDPLPPQGPAPSGVSYVDPLLGTVPVEVVVDSGAARGAASGDPEPARVEPGGAELAGAESEGAGSGGAEPGGAEPEGTEPAGAEPGGAEHEGAEARGAETEGVEPRGAESESAESGGAEPTGSLSPGVPPGALSRQEPLSPLLLREWFARRTCLWCGAAGLGGSATEGTVATGAGGAARVGAGGTRAGAAGVTAAAGPVGACTGGLGAAGAGGAAGVGAGGFGTGGAGVTGAAHTGGARTGGTGAAGAGGAAGVGAGGTGAGVAGVLGCLGLTKPSQPACNTSNAAAPPASWSSCQLAALSSSRRATQLHPRPPCSSSNATTYSMTPRADLLTELEPSPVKHVTLALGQRAEVKGMGKAMFKGADRKMVGLKNVLWVPKLAASLVSVRWLQKAGMDTSSKGARTYTVRLGERILWDLNEDRDVFNEMWQIHVVPMPKQRQVAASVSTKGEAVGSGDVTNSCAKAKEQQKGEENPEAAAEEDYGESMWGTIASAAFSNPTSATGECDWLTLHRHMGHVALPILQQLFKNEMVAGIRVKGEPDEVLGCSTCMQAKFTRYPFSSSEATAKAPLDEVVMDVVGLVKLGATKAEYFLTIVDVYTRMTWVYMLSKKSDVTETVNTDWLPMVEWQQNWLVKSIHTDRGGEFLSKDFGLCLKTNGMRHSFTMPYSPAMNGIAERASRTITETARGLLIEVGLPYYFRPDAVRSACVAKNKALTHVGEDRWMPYVEWIGRKPKVDMLRVFGCMCMAFVPKHLRHNKLGTEAIWTVNLGMAQNSRGWLLWDPFTKKFLVRTHCKFMENLMYMDWKAENAAKIGVRFEEVKSSGLEYVELPLELSSGSTITRQSLLVNGGDEARNGEEDGEEVQKMSKPAPTLPALATRAPRIRVTSQQRRESLQFPASEEEGREKGRIQAPNRLTYDAPGKQAKSALAGAAMMVGDDEESEYQEFAFAFFSPVEMPGEPATLKEALESSDSEEWKKEIESDLKSIEENGTWELVELLEERKAFTSKWLFKIKSKADGKIKRYKSRIVAKG